MLVRFAANQRGREVISKRFDDGPVRRQGAVIKSRSFKQVVENRPAEVLAHL